MQRFFPLVSFFFVSFCWAAPSQDVVADAFNGARAALQKNCVQESNDRWQCPQGFGVEIDEPGSRMSWMTTVEIPSSGLFRSVLEHCLEAGGNLTTGKNGDLECSGDGPTIVVHQAGGNRVDFQIVR
jgi:hypothetical protein